MTFSLVSEAFNGKYSLTWHDYSAEANGLDLGSEIDASASWTFNKYYSALLKLALFDADDFSDDTTKFWLMLTAKF